MKNFNLKVILILTLFVFLNFFSISSQEKKQEISKPLLRVFPVLKIQECEWAIRMDVCWQCLRLEKRYAQKIFFYEDGQYRLHGCYTEKEGFHVLPE